MVAKLADALEAEAAKLATSLAGNAEGSVDGSRRGRLPEEERRRQLSAGARALKEGDLPGPGRPSPRLRASIPRTCRPASARPRWPCGPETSRRRGRASRPCIREVAGAPTVNLALASIALQARKPERADKLALQVLELPAERAAGRARSEAFALRARVALAREGYDDALKLLDEAVKAWAGNAEAIELISSCTSATSRDKALEQLELLAPSGAESPELTLEIVRCEEARAARSAPPRRSRRGSRSSRCAAADGGRRPAGGHGGGVSRPGSPMRRPTRSPRPTCRRLAAAAA
ncbi:MAG: hypothetical protein R3F43_16395 [bacterium]